MIPSQACADLVKQFEGYSATAYLCPARIWTIGYGHTAGVQEGDTCDADQANTWLLDDLTNASRAVSQVAQPSLSQNQFDALTSFVFNVGSGNFANSHLAKYVAAEQYTLAAIEFPKWDHIDGAPSAGLFRRRMAEQAMFKGQSDGQET